MLIQRDRHLSSSNLSFTSSWALRGDRGGSALYLLSILVNLQVHPVLLMRSQRIFYSYVGTKLPHGEIAYGTNWAGLQLGWREEGAGDSGLVLRSCSLPQDRYENSIPTLLTTHVGLGKGDEGRRG